MNKDVIHKKSLSTEFNQMPPYSSTYTEELPKILNALNCTIAVSTYQAGKVAMISAIDSSNTIQLTRNFKKAMGISIYGDRMAIALQDEITVFRSNDKLASFYPKAPKTYDALYMPRLTYYTGPVDIHDIHFGVNQLWAVNTTFSCLCTIDGNFNFVPRWKPFFLSGISGDDRCHLNGLAMYKGKPKFISALGTEDEPYGWRKSILDGGVIIDVEKNEIIADGLAMPHAPRIYNGKLYVLLSAAEKLISIDLSTGVQEVVCEISGFVRGMCKYGEYLFIGTSQVRKGSSTFSKLGLDFAERAKYAGFKVLHLPSKKIVAQFAWLNSVEEVYDVQVIPNKKRVNIINTYSDMHHKAIMTPKKNYWINEKKLEAQKKMKAMKAKNKDQELSN